MNTEETYVHLSSGSTDTENFAEAIASQLRGGEVIELVGDVGAGKTTFVRGLARGIESNDDVSSPTFTLENIYAGRVTLHHLDLYRLATAGLMNNELAEALNDKNGCLVIEWAGLVDGVLPKDRLIVRFEVVDDSKRKLHVKNPYKHVKVEK